MVVVRSSRKSNVELVMDKIIDRRESRISLKQKDRTSFLNQCRTVAEELHLNNKIPREEVQKLAEKNKGDKILEQVFQKALDNLDKVDEDTFYFRDFNQYDLKVESFFEARLYPVLCLGFSLFMYFFLTAVFFCAILDDENVCPKDDDDTKYPGWMTTIYFAAATMSTVGYGDVSVPSSENSIWGPFIGTLFMIISLIYAVTTFSALWDRVYGRFDSLALNSLLFGRFIDTSDPKFNTLPVWKQLRHIKYVRCAEIFLSFLLLNVFGMCIVMIFVKDSDPKWTWMTGFYWAVQTTTTIGYGDLTMPESLRWFNIFFALIGTALLANILGKVANLKTELKEHATLVAWKRREVSKRLIQDMEGNDDGTVDQYEFVVASLITLDIVSKEQISQIMDKFKVLAGNDLKLNEEDIIRNIENQEQSEERSAVAGEEVAAV